MCPHRALLDVRPEVRSALDKGAAIVALESTVISHGLPWPHNLECARAMGAAVRAAGAVPAVIGITDGRLVIGLDDAEVERFARGDGVEKASRRDLATLAALGVDGGTTVAGTVACAALAGIALVATGGIGGVHRDVEETMDVSADLRELGRSPVTVVCSGAKSILDLPRTLEWLETEGVAVIGYRTDRFPAFYLRDGGLPVERRVDDPVQAARIVRATAELRAGGALLVSPVPEESALDPLNHARWVDAALTDARAAGVSGKDVTPFVLDRLEELSGGVTLAANKALLEANATVAGEIACALARL